MAEYLSKEATPTPEWLAVLTHSDGGAPTAAVTPGRDYGGQVEGSLKQWSEQCLFQNPPLPPFIKGGKYLESVQNLPLS